MTEHPLLTAVIVSWNSDEHLGSCISTLVKSGLHSSIRFEIVVVDNNSADDSVDVAKRVGADQVIRNPINAGFAVAASQGIAVAQGSWIIMVNPDLVVDEPFIAVVIDAVMAAPVEVACFAPEIRFSADATRINSRGIMIDAAGLPAEIGKGQLVTEAPIPTRVFAGSGGGSVLRRTALDRVGGFEPLYFAYYEDTDLAWRLQRSGYRAYFLPGAYAYHAGSSTVGVGSRLQTYLVARNRRFLFYRYGPREWKAKGWRMLADTAHACVLCAITKSLTPLYGRASALRSRLYLRYLRRWDSVHLKDKTDLLATRTPFRVALMRKWRSVTLERRP
jgi:GT2 family glycosyltransferase